MTPKNWSVTQRRSQKGIAPWCGVVLQGDHARLDPARPLVPVLRDFRDEHVTWLPEPTLIVTTESSAAGDWWLKPRMRIWRTLLTARVPAWIRLATPLTQEVPHGSVGASMGIYEVRHAHVDRAALVIVMGSKIAEVA